MMTLVGNEIRRSFKGDISETYLTGCRHYVAKRDLFQISLWFCVWRTRQTGTPLRTETSRRKTHCLVFSLCVFGKGYQLMSSLRTLSVSSLRQMFRWQCLHTDIQALLSASGFAPMFESLGCVNGVKLLGERAVSEVEERKKHKVLRTEA